MALKAAHSHATYRINIWFIPTFRMNQMVFLRNTPHNLLMRMATLNVIEDKCPGMPSVSGLVEPADWQACLGGCIVDR